MTKHHPARDARTLTGAASLIALIGMVLGFQTTARAEQSADLAAIDPPVAPTATAPAAPAAPAPAAPAPAPAVRAPAPARAPAAPAPPRAPAPAPAPATNGTSSGSGG